MFRRNQWFLFAGRTVRKDSQVRYWLVVITVLSLLRTRREVEERMRYVRTARR